MLRAKVTAALAYFSLWAFAASAAAQTFPYDHIHLNVPDPAAAANWYEKYFGARRITEAPDRLMFGSTRLLFLKKADAKPSSGGAIDHIGFSFADVDAKMNELQAAGVRVITPLRAVPGIVKVGFVEDPWGVKIELLQDAETLGFHHVHLLAPDPVASMAWYKERFGGETAKLKGVLDGLKYGDVWVLVAKGDATPSVGHAIDHVGWRVPDLDRTLTGLKAKNIKVVQGPTALTLATGVVHYSFVEDPSGTKIEIVQR